MTTLEKLHEIERLQKPRYWRIFWRDDELTFSDYTEGVLYMSISYPTFEACIDAEYERLTKPAEEK